MEKTYQYLGEFKFLSYPHGIHFSPTFTTDDPIKQEFIEGSPKFLKGQITVVSDVPKDDYPDPELEVGFKHSRASLFESVSINTQKLPRLRAVAELLEIDHDGVKRPDLIQLIMKETVK